MPRNNETSKLDQWKERINNTLGNKIYILYNKDKNTVWTAKKLIDNKNIHIQESEDFHLVYDHHCMDPSKINLMKNFLKNFPRKK